MPLPLTSPLGPTIETARLILRPPLREDFDGFCAFFADAESMRHLGGVQSPAVAWRAYTSVAGAWHLDGAHMFSVIEKESGQWIGRIGALYPWDWPGREVGWGLLSPYFGKGYAIEAAAASMDYVFDALGWDRVIHSIAPDNLPSAAVATKLGSYNQGAGKLPDPYADKPVDIWGQTREEWAQNRLRLKT
ncbi:GNAT family N-acetyltransferase [Asticcacaulis solisilvae]|uniref:GNAT family N-acetyltransferase n=1 Tax=Asticcacaulis solisilvae TaxID=1217274 RepID=UPI003FD7DCD8